MKNILLNFLRFKKLEFSIFGLIILISFYRSPFIFTEGRFIGEEATHYFLFALKNNFVENFLYYDAFSGYYNLTANFLAKIATYLFATDNNVCDA